MKWVIVAAHRPERVEVYGPFGSRAEAVLAVTSNTALDQMEVHICPIESLMLPSEYFPCCTAPVDMGHLDGCPNNSENTPVADHIASAGIYDVSEADEVNAAIEAERNRRT